MAHKIIYDVEVFPNCFMVSYCDINGESDPEVVAEVIHDDFSYEENVQTIRRLRSLFHYDSQWWFIGYNSFYYDDIIMTFVVDDLALTQSMCLEIFELSNEVIKDKYSVNYLRYRRSFNKIDLMKIARLRKGLKSVAANLKYWNILEFDHPFDQPISVDYLDDLKEYNVNDVNITKELFYKLEDDIHLRIKSSNLFGVNLMNEDDSGMANRLLEEIYGDIMGLPKSEFIHGRTTTTNFKVKECLSDKISFFSPRMISFFNDFKEKKVGKEIGLEETVYIGNLKYTIAQGGLHSDNNPALYVSEGDTQFIDVDVASYYPNIMLNMGVYPKHLNKQAFLKLLKDLTKKRLEYKAKKDDVAAYAYKILINSIYGKMGFEHHWLYDPKAMYTVTINGQLFLLALIDKLESSGIEVVYANTDGIIVKTDSDTDRETLSAVCKAWEMYYNFELDQELFNKVIIRDVNNYIVEKESGKIKAKGQLNPDRYKDVTKSFDMPIIPMGVKSYFIDGINPTTFVKTHNDPLDFCYVPGVGRKFDVVHHYIENGQMVSEKIQRHNRLYVSRAGGNVVKQNPKTGKEISTISGEHVGLLNKYEEDPTDIKYGYYISKIKSAIETIENRQLTLI